MDVAVCNKQTNNWKLLQGTTCQVGTFKKPKMKSSFVIIIITITMMMLLLLLLLLLMMIMMMMIIKIIRH